MAPRGGSPACARWWLMLARGTNWGVTTLPQPLVDDLVTINRIVLHERAPNVGQSIPAASRQYRRVAMSLNPSCSLRVRRSFSTATATSPSASRYPTIHHGSSHFQHQVGATSHLLRWSTAREQGVVETGVRLPKAAAGDAERRPGSGPSGGSRSVQVASRAAGPAWPSTVAEPRTLSTTPPPRPAARSAAGAGRATGRPATTVRRGHPHREPIEGAAGAATSGLSTGRGQPLDRLLGFGRVAGDAQVRGVRPRLVQHPDAPRPRLLAPASSTTCCNAAACMRWAHRVLDVRGRPVTSSARGPPPTHVWRQPSSVLSRRGALDPAREGTALPGATATAPPKPVQGTRPPWRRPRECTGLLPCARRRGWRTCSTHRSRLVAGCDHERRQQIKG